MVRRVGDDDESIIGMQLAATIGHDDLTIADDARHQRAIRHGQGAERLADRRRVLGQGGIDDVHTVDRQGRQQRLLERSVLLDQRRDGARRGKALLHTEGAKDRLVIGIVHQRQRARDAVHALQLRVDERVPQLWPHLQPALLAPIVTEVDGVNVVLERLVDLGDVVVGDRREQLVDKTGVVVEVHHQLSHPPHRPGALVEAEPDVEDPEAITVRDETLGDVGEETRRQRIGKGIPLERRAGQHPAFHDADVLVHAAIPDHAEDILEPVIAQIGEEPNPVAKADQVVVENRLQVPRAVVRVELLGRLIRKPHRPGDVGRRLPLQRHPDDVTFLHRASLGQLLVISCQLSVASSKKGTPSAAGHEPRTPSAEAAGAGELPAALLPL